MVKQDQATKLPAAGSLVKALKSLDFSKWTGRCDEADKLDNEAEKLESKLLNNAKLKQMRRKVQALRDAHYKKRNELYAKKRDLILRIELTGVTTELVAEVKKMMGWSDA